jgi:uncharacterized protein Usg
MSKLALQLRDYRLTTAQILYHMPDHPGLLQTYVWQEYDIAPEFPQLRKFLHFWEENLDGPLHSVTVGSLSLVGAGAYRYADCQLSLH